MARKNKKKPVREVMIEAPPTAETEDYTIESWGGKPKYCCKLCPFDTLELGRMQAHIDMHLPEPPRPGGVPVGDKRGNDVTARISETKEESEVIEVGLEEISSNVDEDGDEHKTFTMKEEDNGKD